jgi:hypothetical protein
LILMGSIARHDHVPGYSGLNLFLVVQSPRSLRHGSVRKSIGLQRKAFPEFYNRFGALVSVTIVGPKALTTPRWSGSPGLLNSINRGELRTTGIIIEGGDLLVRIPDEPLRREGLEGLYDRYRGLLPELQLESYFGRMSTIKSVLHRARSAVLARGTWVVDKLDILREFKGRWPELMGFPNKPSISGATGTWYRQASQPSPGSRGRPRPSAIGSVTSSAAPGFPFPMGGEGAAKGARRRRLSPPGIGWLTI